MSMRFLEKTAIHSGGGTAIMGPINPCRSGGSAGGGAGLMAGRSWRFLSESVSATFLRSSRIWRLRRGEPFPRLSDSVVIGVADLDGDGLTDLWGEADGQLRAFRGEAPELWRTLDSFVAARELSRWGNIVKPAADLDGDGIGDTLITGPRAPSSNALDAIASHGLGLYHDQGFADVSARANGPPGSRTAVARSGRDGHLIWKTELDPRRIWFERDHGEFYSLTAQALPAGDLDGDGTPDVSHRAEVHPGQQSAMQIKQTATLPLEVLSGRTGSSTLVDGAVALGIRGFWLLVNPLGLLARTVVQSHG